MISFQEKINKIYFPLVKKWIFIALLIILISSIIKYYLNSIPFYVDFILTSISSILFSIYFEQTFIKNKYKIKNSIFIFQILLFYTGIPLIIVQKIATKWIQNEVYSGGILTLIVVASIVNAVFIFILKKTEMKELNEL